MVSQMVLGVVGMAPGLAVLYFILGRHEGHFRHEAMFLALVGGLVLGLGAAVAELFIMTGSAPLFAMFTLPLVETMAKTMLVGLPRFRRKDEAVLLGGAAGIGLAAMLLIFYGQFARETPLDLRLGVSLVAVSVGFTLTHFVSGLVVGVGPAEGRILSRFLPSYALLLPAHMFFALAAIDLQTGANRPLFGSALFAGAMAVYGAAILAWKGPGLLRRGLPPAERARWRRGKLRSERGEV